MYNIKHVKYCRVFSANRRDFMNKPRLGHIHFLNVLPLTYGLNNLNLKEGLELRNGVPAVMNNDLLTGRVDASEVSSIVYARNYEDLLVLPDLCVRADGEVRSILLVSKKPIEEINEDKIILTAQSATAHCLLKIIMAKAYDASPRYYTRNLTPAHPVPNDATASLLIGDDALYVYHHQQKDKYYYYDLGRGGKSSPTAAWSMRYGRCTRALPRQILRACSSSTTASTAPCKRAGKIKKRLSPPSLTKSRSLSGRYQNISMSSNGT